MSCPRACGTTRSPPQEVHVMLFERKSTLHSGNEVTEKTRSLADQLRPV